MFAKEIKVLIAIKKGICAQLSYCSWSHKLMSRQHSRGSLSTDVTLIGSATIMLLFLTNSCSIKGILKSKRNLL
jgi:hypothetical protein